MYVVRCENCHNYSSMFDHPVNKWRCSCGWEYVDTTPNKTKLNRPERKVCKHPSLCGPNGDCDNCVWNACCDAWEAYLKDAVSVTTEEYRYQRGYDRGFKEGQNTMLKQMVKQEQLKTNVIFSIPIPPKDEVSFPSELDIELEIIRMKLDNKTGVELQAKDIAKAIHALLTSKINQGRPKEIPCLWDGMTETSQGSGIKIAGLSCPCPKCSHRC